ncbi:MAG: hypothetical protein O7F10_05120, partial [Deltaproteobacteria bacterium]|nr:hypothetical protein [Deltaproteobacteria bacterium]
SGAADDAYDAGRALHPVDPALAEPWFDRIPESRRASYPRLAYYAAQRALTAGAQGQALRDVYTALADFLVTAEGRSYPGGHELASRVAWQLGDRSAARGHADADADQRVQRAQPHLRRARTALEAR